MSYLDTSLDSQQFRGGGGGLPTSSAMRTTASLELDTVLSQTCVPALSNKLNSKTVL